MPADPTMTLLKRFDDPEAWDHLDRGVPIMKPHIGRHFNPITKKRDIVVDYTVERLQRMVNTNVARCMNSASVPLMVLKHDDEDPEIVGYWTNFRMGTFGPTQKPAMLADRFFLPGTYSKAKTYPFRSVEFYPTEYCEKVPDLAQPEDHDAITAIALLKTDPQLDLGLTTYAKCRPVCYSMEGADQVDPATIPGVQPQVTPGAPPAPGTPPGAPGLDPMADKIYQEFKPHFQRCMSEMYGGLDKFYQAEVAPKYGGAMAMPGALAGGGPPGKPGEGKEKPDFPPKKEKDEKPEKEKMGTSIKPETLAQLLDPATYAKVMAAVEPPPAPEPPPPAPAPLSASASLADVQKQWQDQLAIERAQYQKDLKARDDRFAKLESSLLERDHAVFMAKYEKDMNNLLNNQGKDLVIADEVAECKDATAKMGSQTDWETWSSKRQKLIVDRYGSILTDRRMGNVGGMPIVHDDILQRTSPDKAASEYDIDKDAMVVVHYQESLGLGYKHFEDVKQRFLKVKPEAVKYQRAHPELDWEQCCKAVLPQK